MKIFSTATMSFLMENRIQNSKVWFAEHKQDYHDLVLAPFEDFVSALSPALLAIDEKIITEPRVDRTISRIYRDTRFSKDKSLYRDVIWCTFTRDKKSYHVPPCFFFELSPQGFQYGCGYFSASVPEMEALRALILEGHASFGEMLEMYEGQEIFVAEGESYKKNRYPTAPESQQPWLNRRNLYFTHRSEDFSLLYSDRLAEVVGQGFRLLQPVYEFLLAAHARVPRQSR